MAVQSLRCKECGASYPLDAQFRLRAVLRPARGRLRPLAILIPRRRAEDPGRVAWDLALLGLPSFDGRPRDPLEPGLTPLIRADRLAERLGLGELWIKNDAANPTHSFKDRVVAVAVAKAKRARLRDGRLRLDREPGQRRGRPRGRRRAGLIRLRPRRPRGAEAARDRDLRHERSSASAAPTTTSTGSARSCSQDAPVGLRQRQPAPVLLGGLEDARPSRRSSSSAGSSPTAWSARSPRGRCSPRSPRACANGSSSDWSRVSCPTFCGAQALGCSPVGDGLRRGLRGLPPAAPGHDRQEPRDRRSRRRPLRAGAGARAPAARSSRSPTRRSATGSGCSPRRPASSPRRRAA